MRGFGATSLQIATWFAASVDTTRVPPARPNGPDRTRTPVPEAEPSTFAPDRPSLSNAPGRVPPGKVMVELGTNQDGTSWTGDGISARFGLLPPLELRARLPGLASQEDAGAAARIGIKVGGGDQGPIAWSLIPEWVFGGDGPQGSMGLNLAHPLGPLSAFASGRTDLGPGNALHAAGGGGFGMSRENLSLYAQVGHDSELFVGGGTAVLIADQTQVDLGVDANPGGGRTLHLGFAIQR